MDPVRVERVPGESIDAPLERAAGEARLCLAALPQERDRPPVLVPTEWEDRVEVGHRVEYRRLDDDLLALRVLPDLPDDALLPASPQEP
jgi:hypothetical protein